MVAIGACQLRPELSDGFEPITGAIVEQPDRHYYTFAIL